MSYLSISFLGQFTDGVSVKIQLSLNFIFGLNKSAYKRIDLRHPAKFSNVVRPTSYEC